LYNQWIETYQREHPAVSITYDAVGSGEGVRRFVAGSVDFGASDVVLSDREAAQISEGAVMIPATAGMIVLAYNLPGLRGEFPATPSERATRPVRRARYYAADPRRRVGRPWRRTRTPRKRQGFSGIARGYLLQRLRGIA